MLPLRPRSGACCHLGRQMPTGRLLALIHPAHDDADQNASNDLSRQIVPQQQTPLSKRHTAALLQWQPFAAILELSRFEISPRNVARLYQTTCGGFLFPATHQSMPPGFKPPQHCASPGEPGLPTILLARSATRTPPLRTMRDAFQESVLLLQQNEKGRRMLPLRPRSGACCH